MFSVRDNIALVERDLTELQAKELPFATALALTKTAQAVQKDIVAEMGRVFDRPVPFTLRGTYVKPAKKNDLDAAVYFRTFAGKGVPAGKYLQAQIYGGVRAQKGAEKALARAGLLGNKGFFVPGPGVKLNQYGNVTGGTIKAILSDIGAGNAEQTMRKATKGRSQRRRREQYFIPRAESGKRASGVWVRRGREIKIALIFVSSASYQVRFRFHEVAAASATRHFGPEFDAAWRRALGTSRHR
jgi:hypothetical protein